MSEDIHDGGCLCGGIRYRVTGPIKDIAHCHCSMCRRAAGAVAVTWFTVPAVAFQVTRGRPKVWRSSPSCERGFCPDCGAQITFRDETSPDALDVTLATLDDAEGHPAGYHIFADSALSWLRLDEHLPRHAEYPD